MAWLKIGHRGASAHASENTLAAFRKALELGADGVELDVHLCKSGELIVLHDDTVDRTTDGSGAVAELTLTQLRRLRTREGETLPTLSEALDLLDGACCFIEIKHGDAAMKAAQEIQSRITAGWQRDRLWLISFRHAALAKVRIAYPQLCLGMSFRRLTKSSVREAHLAGGQAIIPHYRSFTDSQVREAQSLGLKVICWTVNDPADIARLGSMHMDGIMSDYPERL